MRSKRALRNLIANLLLQVVTVIGGLLVPILIIKTYGSDVNGLNASINQAIAYLHLVEAGIGMASIQALYSPLAIRKWKAINGILSASQHLYNKSGFIFIILVCCLAIIYPFIVDNEIDSHISIGLVLILGGGGVIEYFLHGKYRVLLTADQKGYIIFNVQTLATILSTVLKIVLILEGSNILIVQAVSTVVFLIRVLLLKMYIRKHYSNVVFNEEPDIKSLNKKNDIFLHQISFLVLNSTDILIITIFCSLNDVSVYSIYNIVFGAIGALVVSLSASSLTAAFGQLIAMKDYKTLKVVYEDYEFVYFIFIFWVFSVTFLMVLPFIELYTANVHDVNYMDQVLPYLFVTIGIFNHARNPLVALINAAGHFKETKYRALIEAIINLVASLILVNFYGVYGVLIGSIMAFIYRTTDTIWYANYNILKQYPSKTLKRLLINASFGGIIALFFIKIYSTSINSWFDWIIHACIVSLTALGLMIVGNTLFEPKTTYRVIKRINLIIGKNA
ncbi:polysaccharide transport protein [Peribacillus simplex]|uniref:lipopolysaccharide biosynthesis protein n=1 Tax=Peribacillus simplex TaxID=1478 RepID=UPI003D2D3B0B